MLPAATAVWQEESEASAAPWATTAHQETERWAGEFQTTFYIERYYVAAQAPIRAKVLFG